MADIQNFALRAHCVHGIPQGGRREAEVFGRVEDTVYERGKPLHQNSGVHRRSAESQPRWGVQALKKSTNRGSLDSSHTPPSHSSSCVTGSRGGGGVEQVLRTWQPASKGQPSWGTTSPPPVGPSGRITCASLVGQPRLRLGPLQLS